MEKIWIISHYYDNGESYEDYAEFQSHEFYSTFNKAYGAYCNHVFSDYEGKYYLIEKTLDTQEGLILEESPIIECTSQWDSYFEEYEPTQDDYEEYHYDWDNWEERYYCTGEPKHPELDIETAWEYLDWLEHYPFCTGDDISEEDDKAWMEYVTTPGTNYREWEECEEEIRKMKEQIWIDSHTELLDSLVELLDMQL